MKCCQSFLITDT